MDAVCRFGNLRCTKSRTFPGSLICKIRKKYLNTDVNREMFRLERLEHLAEKFRRKCALYEEWAYGKEDVLRSSDWRSCGLYKIKVIIVYEIALHAPSIYVNCTKRVKTIFWWKYC